MSNVLTNFFLTIGFALLVPQTGFASVACPSAPCSLSNAEECEQKADWIIEGTVTGYRDVQSIQKCTRIGFSVNQTCSSEDYPAHVYLKDVVVIKKSEKVESIPTDDIASASICFVFKNLTLDGVGRRFRFYGMRKAFPPPSGFFLVVPTNHDENK